MCITVYFTQALQKSFHALNILTKIEIPDWFLSAQTNASLTWFYISILKNLKLLLSCVYILQSTKLNCRLF